MNAIPQELLIPVSSNEIKMSLANRQRFCQQLDFAHPLGYDWKWFAGDLEITRHELQIISENNSFTSKAEAILQLLEKIILISVNKEYLKMVLKNMKRDDLLVYLS